MSRTQRRYRTKCPSGWSHHHRLPKSRNGSNHPSNISLVTQKAHNWFHALWGNMTVHEIAEDLNRRWVDPHYKVVVVPV
ncbi:MAG: hypothetical protein ACP5N7_05845 [Candidatus Pacearchaeota archaeon]